MDLHCFIIWINFVIEFENVAKLWRFKELDVNAVVCFFLKNFFSTPKKSIKVYVENNSNVNPKPHPKSNVATKNQYYYQNRKAVLGFFNGPDLMSMTNRFSTLLIREIGQFDIDHEWTNHENLYRFIQNLLINPAFEALCGPVLLKQNSTFGNDLWKINHNIYYFFKNYPR